MIGDEKRVKAELLRDACAFANRRACRLRTHVADSYAILHVIFLNEPSVARHLYVMNRRLRERVAIKLRYLIAQFESRMRRAALRIPRPPRCQDVQSRPTAYPIV